MSTETWERQPGESAKAFEAFRTYRDAGAGRSLQKVVQEWGKSRSIIGRWSTQHEWVSRAQAHDLDLDRLWLTERRGRLREAARRNADVARQAMDKVAEKIEQLTAGDIPISTIPKLMEAASKLEQLALDGPTAKVAITGPNGGPIEMADVGLLTDEERNTRMQTLRRELTRRLEDHEEPNQEGTK